MPLYYGSKRNQCDSLSLCVSVSQSSSFLWISKTATIDFANALPQWRGHSSSIVTWRGNLVRQASFSDRLKTYGKGGSHGFSVALKSRTRNRCVRNSFRLIGRRRTWTCNRNDRKFS
ncbi:hypothetical protein RHGRI_007533 [Rhododendron griersonianum]|uniref:Uncharacterized protein n=1 Tax=Rhododendron griersonianum TaxID=479676 RepID=A0AAV6KYS4_9ERIC|nr:hypothetical protein RHGRI_007533 [Rhododendron griersonianum]